MRTSHVGLALVVLTLSVATTRHDARARRAGDLHGDQTLRSDDAHRVVDLPDPDRVVGRGAAAEAMTLLADLQAVSIEAGTFCLLPKLQIADAAERLQDWGAEPLPPVADTLRWVRLWRDPMTRSVAVQERPWHEGTIHKGCTRTGQAPAEHGHDSDKQVVEWRACSCQHTCEPGNDETNGRKWDPTCAARCSASHCHCPNKCGQTAVRE